jgi:WD40 repeat protein
MASGTYDAFISYSHSMDGRLAPALRSALEQLAKPWRRRRALRVFHDASGLGVTPGLWSTIAGVLDRTRYFLLLASPAAAASNWVQEETGYFRSLRGAESIFIVLTDGDCRWDPARHDFDWRVSTAVPPQLSGAYREEPLFIDLRWARVDEQLDLRNPRFRQAVGDLAAPIHGMARDEIDALDLRQYRAARRARRLATTGLVSLTVASLVGGTAAVVNANRARTQERVADSGRLAALSMGYAAEQTDRAILLAQHSLRRANTREGRLALATAMTRPAAGYGALPGSDFLGQVLTAGPERHLAAGSGSGEVAIWPQDGRVSPQRWTGHTASISELAFSPGETSLASVDLTGRLLVREVASGSATWRADGIADAVFTPSGDLLEAGLDGRVALRALPEGQWRWSRPAVSPRSRSAADRTAIAVSPDGRWAAVATADARIVLLDARTGKVAASWPTGGADANDLVFNPSSTALLAAGDDGISRIWLVGERRLYAELGGALSGVRRVAWSPDGTTVAAGGFDARVRLYDVRARRLIGELTGHAWPIGGLSYGADGRKLWTGDRDGVRTWNPATGRPERRLERDARVVTAALFSPNGEVLVTQGPSSLVLWDPREDFRPVRIPTGGFDAALTPDGRTAFSVGTDSRVRGYATTDGRLVGEYGEPGGARLSGVAVSPDGAEIATVDLQGLVAARETATGRVLWSARLLADGFRLIYTVDGRSLVVIGLDDRAALLVDAETGAVRARWEVPQPEATPTALAVSPDGQQVLIGRSDGRLTVFDPKTLQPVREILAHQNKIYAVAVSPDSAMIATGGFNGGGVSESGFDAGLRLWDGLTGQLIGQLVAHDGQVEALGFSPDGRWLVSGGFDGQVLIWPAYETWRERACAVAGRELDEAERQLLSPNDRDARVC